MRLVNRIACVGVLAVLVAGCGGSSDQKVTIDATPAALRKSAEATLNKGTAKVDFTMDIAVLGQNITLRGTGVMDPPHKRFQLDFDAKDLFTKLLGANGTPPPEVQSELDKPLTEIIDGTVFYMHFPLLARSGGNGKEWLKIDLASTNSDLGAVLGSGGGGAFGSDPSSFLQFLEGAGKVTKVGEEDVRGVKTTHLSGSYTLKDALSSLPEDRREKVEKAFEGLGVPTSAEDQEIPFDAWVGDDGLVRRLQTSIDPSAFTASQTSTTGKVSFSIEFFDFGMPTDITVPADDEVTDLASLRSGAGSKFSSVASSIGN